MPQSSDAIVKPVTDVISRRLRPKCRASQPVSGSTIALATRYDVSTHVDSSIDADRLPAMCGSDTLTTVVSSTSMNVANMTAIATIHGLTCGCSAERRSSRDRVDVGDDRHAGTQAVIGILAGFEHDLDRHALHDLHVVAGGVFGRQQAELRAGRGGDAVDVALERAAAERVDVDRHPLARAASRFSCVSLKLAVTQTSSCGDEREKRLSRPARPGRPRPTSG